MPDSVKKIIDRLEAMEPAIKSLDTIEMLFRTGAIAHDNNITRAGDWDVTVWSNSADGAFTVGFMQRARKEGLPFPGHTHCQKLWLLATRGEVLLEVEGKKQTLKEGGYSVVEPCVLHEIYPVSDESVVLFVLIPSDSGFDRCKLEH